MDNKLSAAAPTGPGDAAKRSSPANAPLSPQEALKRAAAAAALDYLVEGSVVGVGSGSTVNHFIELLGERKHLYRGAVSSSEASSNRLRAQGIEVFDLNELVAARVAVPVYVDGADEINAALQMI